MNKQSTKESTPLSIVVPAYKQADSLISNISQLDSYLKHTFATYELIVVVDGNTDGSCQALALSPDLQHVQVICFAKNGGKGQALAAGFRATQHNTIAYIDAGGDINHTSLKTMLQLLHSQTYDIVIGSKRHPASQVRYPWLRRLYSRLYQTIVSLFFKLSVTDTQVGLKVFRREVITDTLPHLRCRRFGFDLELLVVANNQGYHQIIEAPVIIEHNFRSTINLLDAGHTLVETVRIFFTHRR